MMLTVKDVAQRLNVSASCIYQLVESGTLAHHRIGLGRGAIRFRDDDLDEFLDHCKQEKGEPVRKQTRPKLKHLKL